MATAAHERRTSQEELTTTATATATTSSSQSQSQSRSSSSTTTSNNIDNKRSHRIRRSNNNINTSTTATVGGHTLERLSVILGRGTLVMVSYLVVLFFVVGFPSPYKSLHLLIFI